MSGAAGIVSVYATFGTRQEADTIGRAMVERRLAACVNILGDCRSIYRWQGKVEEADEIAALFKTHGDTAPALIAAIADMHSYDLPAAVVWPIADASPGYATWVADETHTPSSGGRNGP